MDFDLRSCGSARPWVAALVWLTTVFAAVAAEPAYEVAPPPSWVQRVEVAEAFEVPLDQVSGGTYYLLADRQLRQVSAGQALYAHFAAKALDANGVDNLANLEISFDPSYERLTIHSVGIRRAGERVDKLASATVRMLQREEDLEYRLFDGTMTASVVLDDVRIGDVVEHAYTITGSNPVFGVARFGQLQLQWSTPVHRQFARLVVEDSTRVRIEPEAAGVLPTVTERGGFREYLVDRTGVAPLLVESDAPDWYDPYPRLSWTSFDDWGAVSRWAEPLYRVPEQPDAALAGEIERIRREARGQPARLLEALRFVQREIRYLGVEIGVGSHAPSNPALVLQRRFGDCKDKALLLVTMLRALGIDAQPALVSSTRGKLDSMLPSPFAFDHVIVHARLGDRSYWLDPTRQEQRSDIDRLFEPDFGLALLVDASSKALVTMKVERPVERRTIHAVIDASGALTEPAKLTVTTTNERGGAEALRSGLAASSLEEIGSQYLNFYAAWYPGLRSLGPVEVKDDHVANRVVVTERYQLPEFWKRPDFAKRTEALVESPDILEYLQVPDERIRRAPIGLKHPLDVRLTTEVLLPDTWTIEEDSTTAADPHFRYARSVRGGQTRRAIIVDEYQSLADHVAAADSERFASNLEKARASIGLTLYTPEPLDANASVTASSINWLVALLATLIAAFTAWLALRLYCWDPAPPAGRAVPSLTGIGGWLLLPAFGTLVAPLAVLYWIWSGLGSYSLETWSSLTMPSSDAYHALWAPLLLFELAANITLFGFSLLLIVLFFKKRSSVPRLYIGLMIYTLVVDVADVALAALLEREAGVDLDLSPRDAIRTAVSSLIWTAYFVRSERVRSTFTRRRVASAISATASLTESSPVTDISGFPSADRPAG